MSDVSLSTKSMVLFRLSGDAEVTSLVSADKIFPMRVPSDTGSAFLRYGPPHVRPYEHSCGRGTMEEITIHAFVRGEADCQRVASAVQRALQDMPGLASSEWQRTQFILDDDKTDVWHAVVDFEIVNIQPEGQT